MIDEISEYSNEFQLELKCQNFNFGEINETKDISFDLKLYSLITKKSWIIKKKYSDLMELDSNLKLTYLKVPYLPQITDYIDQTQLVSKLLEDYCNILVLRPDFISSLLVKYFLELENHFINSNDNSPYIRSELFGFKMKITYLEKKENYVFIGFGKDTTDIIDSIVNFFVGDEKLNYGKLSIMKEVDDSDQNTQLYEFDQKNYESPITFLNYNIECHILTVGLENGKILLYQNNKIFDHNETFEEIFNIRAHKAKVICVYYQKISGYIFSVGKERILALSELHSNSILKIYEVSKFEIVDMKFDEENNRLFILNCLGTVWILSVSSIPPKVLCIWEGRSLGISCLEVNLLKNFIFIGMKNMVSYFEFEDADESNYIIKKLGDILFKQEINITKLAYRISKNELFICFDNGSIAIFSHSDEYPEMVIDIGAHEINGIIIDNDRNLLATSNHERIKIWTLPELWVSERLRINQNTNYETIFFGNSVGHKNFLKLKNAFQDVNFSLINDHNPETNFKKIKEETSEMGESITINPEKKKVDVIKGDLLGWDL